MSIVASRMTMRAVVKRSPAGTDGYGGPVAGQAQTINPAAPCFVYTKSSQAIAEGGKVVQVEQVRGLFAADEDIQDGDTIASVADRNGVELFAGPFYVNIDSLRTAGAVPSHLEVTLKRSR